MSTNACADRKKAFTLMLLDLDDTLIPTSIRRFLFKNFAIDIFKLLKQTSLKRLQLNIIRSLQMIRQKLIASGSTHHHMEIALVSNAGSNWLKRMFHSDEAYFDIFYEYFVHNNITIHSAKGENDYKAPRDRYAQREKQSDLWILKYKSISALIDKKQNDLNMKCRQIVSFGDGFNEREALKVYSNSKGSEIRCIHFEMMKAPTVYQLSKQWNVIANEIDIVSLIQMDYFVSSQQAGDIWTPTNYLIYAVNQVAAFKKQNNNEECTGKHQLSAISKYFRIWVESVKKNQSKYRSKVTVIDVAERVHFRRCVMQRNNKYENTPYQKVVDVFSNHRQFRNALRNVAIR